MGNNKRLQKCMAIILSVFMVTGLMPSSATAETGSLSVSENGEIISFEVLKPEIKGQTVPLGTSEAELGLPVTLAAEVRPALTAEAKEPEMEEQVQASEESQQEQGAPAEEQVVSAVTGSAVTINEEAKAGQTDQQSTGGSDASQSITMNIPVIWTAAPKYDGSTANKYLFIPTLPEGFTLSEGVSLPTIVVTVEQTAYGEITAFDALSDELRWQNTTSPNLPVTISGTVAGTAASIPVTWEADHEYNAASPAKGLYVFTSKVGSAYTKANGLETPKITVYIPGSQQKMMLMAGAGASDSALEITTAAQLAEIATLVNAGRLETFLLNDSQAIVYLTLGNDIDLSNYGKSWNGCKGWVPIGTDLHHFRGMFNGGGYTITGLYINNGGMDYVGLFGYTDGSTLQNLGVADVNITGGNYTGGVAGRVNNGSLTYCYMTGSVTGTNEFTGGIAGGVGGGSLTYCYAVGSVTGAGNLVGGLVGISGDISNCYASCKVTGSEYYVGGVVGSNNGDIANCYAFGEVTGLSLVGGVSGFMNFGSIQNCVALNRSVSAPDTAERIAYNLDGTFAGNAAFSGMKITEGNIPKSTISDAAGIDGEDMDAAVIMADGTLGGRFTAAKGWTVENGKLPGIGKVAEMPDYIISNFNDPYFLGMGTPESPYQISTAAQLAKLAQLVNSNNANYTSKYYKLTADIDLAAYGKTYNSGQGWLPIGGDVSAFSGTFDGDGHIVTGLYINSDTLTEEGLFGLIMNGSVMNLGVVGVDITCKEGVGIVATGSVAGMLICTSMTNCYSTGTIIGDMEAGGLVGILANSSGVTDCYSAAKVTGTSDIGGIVGYIDYAGGTVIRCYSMGAISGTDGCAGGIVGTSINGNNVPVQNCAALNPSATSIYGNPIIGRVAGMISVHGSGNVAFSGMTVNGSTVSSSDPSSLSGADADAGAIAGTGFFQNLFGNDPAWIYSDGKLPILAAFAEGTQDAALPYYISGSYFGGGDGSSEAQAYEISSAAQLVKLAELINTGNSNYNHAKYYKLTDDIDLSDYNSSNTGFNGGKGWIPIGSSPTCAFSGIFDGNGHIITGLYINDISLNYAGLFGFCESDSSVKNLGVTCADITCNDYAGGIIGYIHSGNIEDCYSTGMITGNCYIGGIAGEMIEFGSIRNCYTSVTVNGILDVGGVAGYIENSCTVKNCYASGIVSGTSYVGGLAGKIAMNSSLINCVALNSSISGNSYIKRVAGRSLNSILSGNYSFSGMIGGGCDKTADGPDGADITVTQINTAAFWTDSGNWGTSGWDPTVWTIQDGKLPILKNVGGVQSADSALYLTKRDIRYASIGTGAYYTYSGSLLTPIFKFEGVTLVENKDYMITITSTDGEGTSAGIQAGTVNMLLSGMGNFYGTKSVTYVINKAPAPTLVWPVAAPVTYGSKLSASVLVGGSTTYGSFSWTEGDTVLSIGTDNYDMTFTPSAATVRNYEAITGTTKNVRVTVNKAPAPTLSWPVAAPVTYGAKLLDSVLTSGSTSYGSFSWTDADTIPTVGNNGYSVTFTPNAATVAYYEAITGTTKTVEITVNKAPAPAISWPVAAPVTYGAKLSDSVLTGGSTAYGSFSWTEGDMVPSAGNGSYPVTFTPSAATSANYETVAETTKSVQISVNKAPAPTLSPQTVSINRESASTGNTIDLAALLPADRGTTSYSVTGSNTLVQHISVNASGKLSFDTLSSDSATTENVIIKAEMQNYEDAIFTAAVSLVDKKVPVVTPSVSGTLNYGQTLSNLTISAVALADNGLTPVSGNITWNNPSEKPTVGVPARSWTFTPYDIAIYEIVTGTAAITVNKAVPQGTPVITQISDANKKLSDTVLTGSFTNPCGGLPIPGTLRWDLPDTTVITRGTAYRWTFTPNDSSNYSVRSGSLTPYPGSAGGGSSSGGGYGSGSITTNVTPAPEEKPDQPVTVSVSLTAKACKEGTAGVSVPDKVITDAITKTQSEANAQGKDVNDISVILNITVPKGITSVSVTLSQNALKSLIDAGVSSLKINNLPVSVSFDQKALQTIRSQSSGNVTITAVSGKKLSNSSKVLIGNRPVYNISIGYTKNGEASTVANLDGGTAIVSIPYTLAKGESEGCLYGVYVDSKGHASRINSSAYDTNSGCLLFTTNHFSIYGIGYTAPSVKFTDTSKHWACDSINYVVSRGLLAGTSDTTFSPDKAITRGMLVTALGRLAGVDVSSYQTSSFKDVKVGSYSLPYIEWAYRIGIIPIDGSNQFDPDRTVTREEIAVILHNYAIATGYTLPVTRAAVTFADDSSIGSAYKDAVHMMQQAGIILSKGNNQFDGKAYITRAEVSAILYRYIKLIIDPATAQGWAKNDSGQRMYFKDGKALTDWQAIDGKIYCFDSYGSTYAKCWRKNINSECFYLTADGSAAQGWKGIGGHCYYFGTGAVMISGKWLEISGKWYYFYDDGSLATSTIIDGYKVDKNGVRIQE